MRLNLQSALHLAMAPATNNARSFQDATPVAPVGNPKRRGRHEDRSGLAAPCGTKRA